MSKKPISNDLRKTFKEFDSNSDGVITSQELKKLLKKVVANINDEQIELLLHKLDKNGDDRIDFEEFVKEMDSHSYYSKSNLEETFNFFDRDGSGLIDANELFEAMKTFKNDITKEQVDRIISSVDTDKSGRISLEEFIKLMS